MKKHLFRLRGTKWIVEVIDMNSWFVIAEDVKDKTVEEYPIDYFKIFYKEITEE